MLPESQELRRARVLLLLMNSASPANEFVMKILESLHEDMGDHITIIQCWYCKEMSAIPTIIIHEGGSGVISRCTSGVCAVGSSIYDRGVCKDCIEKVPIELRDCTTCCDWNCPECDPEWKLILWESEDCSEYLCKECDAQEKAFQSSDCEE